MLIESFFKTSTQHDFIALGLIFTRQRSKAKTFIVYMAGLSQIAICNETVPQKSRLRWLPQALPKIGLASVSVYSIACLSLWTGQNRFIFFPQRQITTQPEQYKLSYQEVSLLVKTEDGKTENIHGWWIPANRPNAKVVLYLHGNSQNIGGNLKHANRFHELGFSVFLPDYRGYGKSEGDFPSETQVYADAQRTSPVVACPARRDGDRDPVVRVEP